MDVIQQAAIPVLGIVAAAAVTFYVVSFSELREKSFQGLDDSDEYENRKFESSLSSRKKRARRKTEKQNKP